MSLGLVAAGGAAGGQAALDDILEKRLAAQIRAKQMEQQTWSNGMREKEFASNEELKHAQLAELAASHQAAEQDRALGRANTLADQIPPGVDLQQSDPAVGMLQNGGRGSLLTMRGEQAAAPPAALLANGDNGQPQELPGTMPNSPMPSGPRLYTKSASATQQNTMADNDRAAARDKQTHEHELAQERIAMMNANNQGASRDLTNQINELKIQAERDKLTNTQNDRQRTADTARQSTETALNLVDRLLGDPTKQVPEHPGLAMSSGLISSKFSGFSQNATDANALRDQLVATLTLPNLGALKGPMSDRDVVFVKQLATRLANTNMSDGETRRALQEARTFLQNKIGSGPIQPQASHNPASAAPADPLGIR